MLAGELRAGDIHGWLQAFSSAGQLPMLICSFDLGVDGLSDFSDVFSFPVVTHRAGLYRCLVRGPPVLMFEQQGFYISLEAFVRFVLGAASGVYVPCPISSRAEWLSAICSLLIS